MNEKKLHLNQRISENSMQLPQFLAFFSSSEVFIKLMFRTNKTLFHSYQFQYHFHSTDFKLKLTMSDSFDLVISQMNSVQGLLARNRLESKLHCTLIIFAVAIYLISLCFISLLVIMIFFIRKKIDLFNVSVLPYQRSISVPAWGVRSILSWSDYFERWWTAYVIVAAAVSNCVLVFSE